MATIDYDNIQLNLTSAFNDKGAEEAIDNLDAIGKGLKELDSSSVKEATQDFRDFAEAVSEANNANSNVLDALDEQRRAKDMEFARAWNAKGTEFDTSSKKRKASFYNFKDIVAEDSDTNKTGGFLGAIADTYNKLMDTLGIYKQIPPTVEEIMEKMGDVADKTSQVGKEAKKSLNPLEKLAKRLKNLLVYRALRFVISGMANAVKEGFKNLEDWDRNIGMTGFADSMDRARESLTVLKNSLAVITAPALEWLIGILQRVAQFAMTAANAISRFFAILGGKSSYRAVKWADSVADSQSRAGSSAKKATAEFKKQLMAFDEINNLTAPSDSGSGGGGGGGASSGYTDMFEDVALDKAMVTKVLDDINRKMNEFYNNQEKKLANMKRMWKLFFTDNDAWRAEWAMKFNVAIETFKRNLGWVKPFVEMLGALATGQFDVVAQKAKEVDEALQRTTDQNKVGVELYGDAWLKATGQAKEGVGAFVGRFNSATGEISEAVYTTNSKIREMGGVADAVLSKRYNLEINSDSLVTLKSDLQSTFDRKYWLQISISENVTRHVQEVVQSRTKSNMWYANYATGGFPTQGQMFIAREAGPELVGTIGGQTAVVNNSDIVASVSQGVAQAVASVLGGGQQVNVTLEGDAKNLFKVVQREGRAYSARTGQPALA